MYLRGAEGRHCLFLRFRGHSAKERLTPLLVRCSWRTFPGAETGGVWRMSPPVMCGT